jgi:hypothetical protein
MNADKIGRGTFIGGVRVEHQSYVILAGRRVLAFRLADQTMVYAQQDGWVDSATPGRRDLPAGPVRRSTRVELKASIRERQTSRGEGLGLASSRRA